MMSSAAEIALYSSDRLLTATEFIASQGVDDPYRLLPRFWGNIENGSPVIVDSVLLDFLGYKGTLRTQKHRFKRLLETHDIPFENVTINDAGAWPELASEIAATSDQTKHQLHWVVISGADFKRACLHAQTSRSRDVIDFYVQLETHWRNFTQYVALFTECAHATELVKISDDNDEQLATVRREANDQLITVRREANDQQTTMRKEVNDQLTAICRENEERLVTIRRETNDQLVTVRKEALEHLAVVLRDTSARVQRAEAGRRTMAVAATDARKRLHETTAQLRMKQARYVQRPSCAQKEETVIMIAMAPNYKHTHLDPSYMKGCTHVFIRVQEGGVDSRLADVKKLGGKSNRDARIVCAVKTANSCVLFQNFKRAMEMQFPGTPMNMFACTISSGIADAITAVEIKIASLLEETELKKLNNVEYDTNDPMLTADDGFGAVDEYDDATAADDDDDETGEADTSDLLAVKDVAVDSDGDGPEYEAGTTATEIDIEF